MDARMLLKSWAMPPARGPDGLHFFRFEKLLLQALSIGDVPGYAGKAGGSTLAVMEEGNRDFNESLLIVLPDEFPVEGLDRYVWCGTPRLKVLNTILAVSSLMKARLFIPIMSSGE